MRAVRPAEIKRVRDELEMTQAEFAEAFHLSRRTVEKWERGGSEPTGPAGVLMRLITRIPRQIIKALRDS
jgi:putative transcriptional regulator